MALYKKSFIFFTILYVSFFVKSWGSVTGSVYFHDDVVYYTQTASLVNDFDIDISNNFGNSYKNLYLGIHPNTGRIMTYQPLGTTLFYIIPYLVTKPLVYLSCYLRGVAFDECDPIFFVVLCFFTLFLFFVSGMFIQRTLSRFFEQPLTDIVAIFVLWGTILPVYVFRRPIFGVIPEFFLVSWLLYYIVKIYHENKISLMESATMGLIAGWLFITRWNDIYFLPFCLIILIKITTQPIKESDMVQAIRTITIFIFAISCFIFLQCLAWLRTYGSIISFLSYYYDLHKQFISSKNTWVIYIKNLGHIFFGLDWGVIFTMPVLFGGAALIFTKKLCILRSKIIQAMLFLFIFWACFHVVLQWKNTGEFYGYRFLIALLPLSAIGFAEALGALWQKHRKIITRLIILFCIFNFFIILPFELTEKTTLHSTNITPMGGAGWGNNRYFLNALEFYFRSDTKTLISGFSRGYLGALGFGVLSLLGVDLAKFGPKVKGYFALSGYKSYVAFLYPLLVLMGIFYLNYRKKYEKS